MTRGFMRFVRGVGIGMAVGAAAGCMGSCYVRSNRRHIKKNVGRALRNMGDLVDNVTGMF